jgi:hypothetical protein
MGVKFPGESIMYDGGAWVMKEETMRRKWALFCSCCVLAMRSYAANRYVSSTETEGTKWGGADLLPAPLLIA